MVVMAGGFVTEQAINLHLPRDEHPAHIHILGVDLSRFTRASARQVPREFHQEIEIIHPKVGRFEGAGPAPIRNRNLGAGRRIRENPRLAWSAGFGIALGGVEVPAVSYGLVLVTPAASLGC